MSVKSLPLLSEQPDFSGTVTLDRVSVELTNACPKACEFCYNHSHPSGATHWGVDELVQLLSDCAAHGVRAVSLGGGEPLVYPRLWELLTRLRGQLFRSLTTSGWRLSEHLEMLADCRPDKVHVSIHYPQRPQEVDYALKCLAMLESIEVRGGVNLLVDNRQLSAAALAAERLRQAGIDNQRIVYLPMRMGYTPTPEQVGQVAGGLPFQSTSCLAACARSPRFCSISWDRQVAWCSYTSARVPLNQLTYGCLTETLASLPLRYCG